MSIARAYREGGKGKNYRDRLEESAQRFGIDPESVRGMKQPVLVRRLTATPSTGKGLAELGSNLNRPFTAELSAYEKAVSGGKRLSEDTLDWIGRGLADIGDKATLRQLMEKKPMEIFNRLESDGVLNQREIPGMVDQKRGLLTERGKDLLERTLLGSVIDDPVLLENFPAGIRNKIGVALPSLSQVKARGGEWDITGDLKKAAEAAMDAKNRGMTASQYLAQQDR